MNQHHQDHPANVEKKHDRWTDMEIILLRSYLLLHLGYRLITMVGDDLYQTFHKLGVW
jgi:hypothetical protein